MTASNARDVEICEVGPRDGLQNIGEFVATDAKIAWIEAEAAAGLPEIEVGSFVNPRLIPQFADIAEVVSAAKRIDGLTVTALVPNLKGAERAAACGVHKLSLPISVSAAHSQANVRKSPETQVDELRAIVGLRDGLPDGRRFAVTAGLSTVFGCTLQGAVDEAEVIRLAVACAEAGVDDLSLADTVGWADPAQVRRVTRAVIDAVGPGLPVAGHFHNTRGLGLANVLAAYEEGVRTFDACLGGLGGCPYAPGASGNVVTEDLAFMFDRMGIRTGIDLDRLLAARAVLARGLTHTHLTGHLAAAGLPRVRGPGKVAAV